MAAESRRLRGLYVVTPRERDTSRLLKLVGASLEGGAAAVQYRAKDAAASEALEQSLALRALCDRHGALFIVNDSAALAASVGADGVHLGRDDGEVAAARALLPTALIGVSCYDDPRRAHAAARAGAGYVAIGSVFASSTKPGAVRAPLEALGAARGAGVPVVAIGGITPGNAASAIAAGADMVAVISAVFDAPDVRLAARAFAQLFEERQPPLHVRT
jgi:thiamine-phosphate pyrophosphorylase